MKRAIVAALIVCEAVGLQWAAEEPSPETLLLKDFHPRSVYKIPRTEVAKARYPAIDMHAHAYAKTPEQVDRWVRVMDEHGIAKAVVLTGTTGKQFDDLMALYSKYPGRFELWCGFDYTGYDQPGFGPAAVKELQRCFDAGARGVGELGDKGKGLVYCRPTKAWGMHLDDPRMDGLLEKCADMKMPINIHVADPYWMYEPMDARNDGLMNAYTWRLDDQPGIVGHAGMVDILERAVKRHPNTTFVACHFANCSYDFGRLAKLFDECPNLYADISARYAETAAIPRFTAKFYETYQDRLVYGTDMGLSPGVYRITFRILESADEHFYDWDNFSYHWPLHGLALGDSVLEKVYRTNALKILHK
ncbi:MAG: amidohydrolase family protein [Sedimentisphaerales bacterium]|jgi:predicted TIM-barrel fold metal-dependent hydrolase|nr:amidohydrolase family protein [Sedimentisphaerales bacterium]HNY76746.1 amidohydrolase family protein [Sedimentisphaerales bacterium]HOC61647.1 amidohydrolase family protein [Sedimentisphaerales bacterium]HOH62479.1 amidohydrolase family protein [Sedimentisphaerales bacterium]HPY50640.1 amidohydrolase family protein [Sedimentisphaerales bacterium]